MNITNNTGIYAIESAINNAAYAGSTLRGFRTRKGQHWGLLRNGKHDNQHLQYAWNKYGEDAFVFRELEVIDTAETIKDREDYWIDHYRTIGRCYNVSPGATPNKGMRATDEQRQAMSAAQRTPERLQALSAEMKARMADPVYQAKIRAGIHAAMQDPVRRSAMVARLQDSGVRERARMSTMRNTYHFTAPDGTEHTVTDLRSFCREHGLHMPSMLQLSRADMRVKSCKGWTRVGGEPWIARSREKLTADDIPQIRAMHKAGNTNVTIAEQFGVSEKAIRSIVFGRTWKHVITDDAPGVPRATTKLTDTDIPKIRAMYQAGDTKAAIARRFDVDRKTIINVISGKIWKHVPLEA